MSFGPMRLERRGCSEASGRDHHYSPEMFSPDPGQPSPHAEAPPPLNLQHHPFLPPEEGLPGRLHKADGQRGCHPTSAPVPASPLPTTSLQTPPAPWLSGQAGRPLCESGFGTHHHTFSSLLEPPSFPPSWLGRTRAHNSGSITLPAISAGALVTRS